MIAAGVMLYRDDTGKTQAEKLAHRVRILRGRPALGAFLVVMFAVVNVAYFGYGSGFAAIRASKAATSVRVPWPIGRRSTTPTGSTRRRGSRVRSSPASGPVGRVPSRAGPTSTRPPTVAGAGEPPAGEPARAAVRQRRSAAPRSTLSRPAGGRRAARSCG